MIRFKPVEVPCNYCGKMKLKKVSDLRVHAKTYCSHKCLNSHKLKMGSTQVQCENCQEVFNKHNSQIKKTKIHFCSKRCYGDYKKTGQSRTCICCENLFYKANNEFKKLHKRFCSNLCNKVYTYLRNNKIDIDKKSIADATILLTEQLKISFHSYRRRAIEQYGLKCNNKNCPIEFSNIKLDECQYEVDHIDSDRNNNYIENLQVLCAYCHAMKTRCSHKVGKNEIE